MDFPHNLRTPNGPLGDDDFGVPGGHDRPLKMPSTRSNNKSEQRVGAEQTTNMPHREIVSMAEARLMADVAFRAECVAYAKRICEGWRWGPRGGLHTT